jgi:hypothetical protein
MVNTIDHAPEFMEAPANKRMHFTKKIEGLQ